MEGMIVEVIIFLGLLLAFYIVTQIKRTTSTTYDEVFIAQFNPKCVADIKKYIKCAKLDTLKVNIYIDFTLKNIRGTRNLHDISRRNEMNVYQKVLLYLMEGFGNKNIPIELFGFGDLETQDNEVFSMSMYQHSVTPNEAIQYYDAVAETVEMSGPRSFCPVLRHAVEQTRTKGQHLVFIITSGIPEDPLMNFEHIVESSWHDVLLIIIGVGEGPWNGMSRLTRSSSEKKFSNSSYLLLDMYQDRVEFLRNIVLTTNDLSNNLAEDQARVEASHQKSD